ncbi:MAG: DUF3850 domain-containing protein [Patescibacteria group bacterium]
MAEVRKKMWPEEFNAIVSGAKKIDIRIADFGVREGDTLILEEWDPKTKQYTGRKVDKKVISVVKFGLDDYGQGEEIKTKGLYAIQLG